MGLDIASWLGKFVESQRNRELREGDDAQKTLLAVTKAARATNRYELWREENGDQRDIEKERDLADLWADAAIYVSRHDGQLAMLLQSKGEYWLRPESWTPEEIRDARIGLDQVTEAADKLLNPKIRRGSF
jgi:hypothetical protein